MMPLITAIWRFWESSKLTIWVLSALVADLLIGYFYFENNMDLFIPLERLLLIDWIQTYGRFNIAQTWWFFVFLGLLGVLVTNTFVCTIGKVAALLRNTRQKRSRLDFFLRFSPHIMHLAFVMILGSYLFSYVGGMNLRNVILLQGYKVAIPGTPYKVELTDLKVDFYQGTRLAFLNARPIDQKIFLRFYDNKGTFSDKILSHADPVWFEGLSVHLAKYYPSYKTKRKKKPYATLIIRKDPGIKLFFAGTLLFVLGLIAYLIQHKRNYNKVLNKEKLDETAS